MSEVCVYKRCGCLDPVDRRRLGARCPWLARRGHGSWYFAVELPAGRDGKRHRLRRGGFLSRAAAEQAGGYWLGHDVEADGSLITVGQWLDIWLQTRHQIRPATRRLYTQHVRDYLTPALGSIVLRELTIGNVQAMFTALIRTTSARGRPLAPTTLHRIRGALTAALNAAIRRGLLTQNPAHWVELPNGRRPRAVVWTAAREALWRATGERPQLAVWTAEHTAQFLHDIREHRLYPLFHLVALLGLRRGEVLGLRWSDLDLKARTLVVSHQVQEHNGRRVICPPKSQTSLRTLALDHGTVAVLRRLRAGSGPDVGTGDFLFGKASGEPLSPGYVTHMFRRLVTECDLPPVRFHDLRHGAASLSLAAGSDLKTVQALLGHDSIVLTADTYTSVLPCLAHQTAEASAALVLKAARKVSRPCRGRSKPNGRKQVATRSRPRASVALGDRIMELTSDSHGTHTRSTPTGKIPTIKETCWPASIQWGCAARDSNPEPAG